MKFRLVLIAITALLVWANPDQAVAQVSGKKTLHAFLSAKKGGKPTTTFSADAPNICAFWEGQGLGTGDAVQAVWIAEDIGAASPKGTEIRRANFRVFKQEQVGEFALSRPAEKTWPVGRYRVELYINGGIADVVKFRIEPGVTIQTH